ncbi:MAG TPA: Rv1355c family protein [Burkholderiales bacterium]|nr:Rv1355c family protein [Burkholderiales bacterium]
MPRRDDLAATLCSLGALTVDRTSHRPQLYSGVEDMGTLRRLAREGAIAIVADTIDAQLDELVRTRSPAAKLRPDEARRAVAHELAGRHRDAYGTWVHYPWSCRLVHVLPEAAYRELRGDRNRYKITTDERLLLGSLRIGVVGLSVGQSIAITLAQEGIGNAFHLADFDVLSLSNLNRIRGGAHAIGCNKAVMTARAITEISPYDEVRVFEGGVTSHDLAAFLEGVDVVIEECDSIDVKVAVRLAARERGVPVVMVNSEGGVLDIERFDREPSRPIFHGLAGEVDPERLRAADHDAKVAFLLPIVGAENLSDRMVASLVEIDASVSTWPQLASGVALGSALVTDAVRRMRLGQLTSSGRFVVNVERLVRDGSASAPTPATRADAPCGMPVVDRVRHSDRVDVQLLVEYAVLAPSGGNAQPWEFRVVDGDIECWQHANVEPAAFDPTGAANELAIGAAVENIDLAARAMGFATDVHWCDAGRLRCRLSFAPAPIAIDPLLDQIPTRCTNRFLGDARPLAPDALTSLRACAQATGTRLLLVEEQEARNELADLVGAADRLRVLSERMLADLAGELRWTPQEVARGDGLDVRTLGLRAGELATLRLLTRSPAMKLLAQMRGGRRIESVSRERVRRASAVALLVREGGGSQRFFAGGRALQRVWLLATELGLAVAPTTTLLFLLRLPPDLAYELLPPGGPEILAELRERFFALFSSARGCDCLFMCMLGRAPAPLHRARRRPRSSL